jgi:Holliday junction resolvase-like predicted endonuclease
MTLAEIAYQIISKNDSKIMSAAEIAENALRYFPNEIEGDIESVKNKFSAAISSDIKRKKAKSKFRKIKNKRGGYQKGKYRLKIERKIHTLQKLPAVTTQYTGKAGEHAVLSELLFNGYNASIMTVDDGIDIVASKNNSYFHIQVKTSTPHGKDGQFFFSINHEKFKQKFSGNTFYIFVLRRSDGSRYFSDFVVLSSSEVKSLISREIIKNSVNLSFRIRFEKPYKYILNKKEDIAYSVNKFNRIT